jgi:hypothetical protein
MENPTVPMTQLASELTPDGARAADYLLHAFGGRLYAYFTLMIADDEAARRALTDTLVGAAADAEQVADPEEWGPRIFLRARTECLRFEHAVAVGGAQRGDAGDMGWSPGLPSIARRAVSRLSPEIREAFVLSSPHNELSLPDLARVLGVTLESAADRRAQAGLDYVRSLALCAEDAGYTTYAGAELRIRAEASLAQDGAVPAPPLPVLTKLLQTARSQGRAPGNERSPGTALAPFRAAGKPVPAPTTELPVLPADPPAQHFAPPTRAERVPPELLAERTPNLPPRGEQFAGPSAPPESPLPPDLPMRERAAPPPTRADPIPPQLLQERMPEMLERRTRMERLAARPVEPEQFAEPPTRMETLPAVSSVEAERFGGPVGPTRMDWLRNSGPYRALTGPLNALTGPLALGGEDGGPGGPGGRRRAGRKRTLLIGGSAIALVVLAGASYEFLFAGTSNSTISVTPAGVPTASSGIDGYLTSTPPRSPASATRGKGTSSSATGDAGSGARQTQPEETAPAQQPVQSTAQVPAPPGPAKPTKKATTSPSAPPTAKPTTPAASPSPTTASPSPTNSASSPPASS